MKDTVEKHFDGSECYDIFWKDFYLSFEKHFLSKSEKRYFVFTDAQHLFDEENNNRIHKIYQIGYSWSYSTLKRYEMFMPYLKILADYNYIFYECKYNMQLSYF